jgi:hypothetical protein
MTIRIVGVMSGPEAQGQNVTAVTVTLPKAKESHCWRVGTVLFQEFDEML